MDPLEILKWGGSTAGVAALIPLARVVALYAKRTGDRRRERDDLLKTTASAVTNLVSESRDHGVKLDEVSTRTTRLEYVLTGDRGENGVRGQVKNLEEQIEGIRSLFVQAGVDAALDKSKAGRRKRKSA